jgi:hypothetical protein
MFGDGLDAESRRQITGQVVVQDLALVARRFSAAWKSYSLLARRASTSSASPRSTDCSASCAAVTRWIPRAS